MSRSRFYFTCFAICSIPFIYLSFRYVSDSSIKRPTTINRSFPQVIIIGVKKGGTSALISLLDLHPQVAAASGEVHYFDRNYFKGIEWYLNQMPPTSDGQLTVEKSPSYFITPQVPLRISQYHQNTKFLLIVRDPLTRIISDYAQLDAKRKMMNRTRPSFESSVFDNHGNIRRHRNIVSVSMYDVHLERWLDYFSKDHFHIVDGEAFVSSPYHEITKVEQFLGISSFYKEDMFYYNKSKGFFCWKQLCLGDDKGRPHPKIASGTREKLRKFLKPHNKQFCLLANQSYWWC